MTTLKGHPDVPAGTALNVRLIWDVPLQGAGRGLSPKHRDATYDWNTGKYMDGQAELTFPHPRAGQNDNALRGPLVAVYTIGTGPLSQTARYPLQAYETAAGELDITVDPNPATVVAAQTLIDLITDADVASQDAQQKGAFAQAQGNYAKQQGDRVDAQLAGLPGAITQAAEQAASETTGLVTEALSNVADIIADTAQDRVLTQAAAAEALGTAGITAAYISDTDADPPAAPNGTYGAKITAGNLWQRLKRAAGIWQPSGSPLMTLRAAQDRAGYHARDWGAAGNGVTDDTAALSAMLAAAPAGTVIDLGDARYTYRLTGQLALPSGLHLRAKGAVLLQQANAYTLNLASGATRNSIEGVVFDGSGAARSFINQAGTATNCAVRHCAFNNMAVSPGGFANDSALRLFGGSTGWIVEDCVADGIGGLVTSGDADHIIVRRNTGKNVRGNAIGMIFYDQVNYMHGVVIDDNILSDVGRMGVELFGGMAGTPGAWRPTIRRNQITNTGAGTNAYGISATNGYGYLIEDNILSGPLTASYGIEAGVAGSRVRRNEVSGYNSGIVYQGGNDQHVSENTLRDGVNGVLVSNASTSKLRGTINNNTIINPRDIGVWVNDNAAEVSIDNNRVDRSVGGWTGDAGRTFIGYALLPGTVPWEARGNALTLRYAPGVTTVPAGFTPHHTKFSGGAGAFEGRRLTRPELRWAGDGSLGYLLFGGSGDASLNGVEVSEARLHGASGVGSGTASILSRGNRRTGTFGGLYSPPTFFADNVAGAAPVIAAGAGDPAGAVAAPPSSLYARTDGASGTNLYVKTAGSGTSGWAALGGAGGSGVTLDTAQTITAVKTFSGGAAFGRAPVYLNSSSDNTNIVQAISTAANAARWNSIDMDGVVLSGYRQVILGMKRGAVEYVGLHMYQDGSGMQLGFFGKSPVVRPVISNAPLTVSATYVQAEMQAIEARDRAILNAVIALGLIASS